MVVIRKFMTEAKADAATAEASLTAFLAKVEANPGVKVLTRTAKSVVVAIEADVDAIAKDPTVQKAYAAVEAQIKKDIEAVGAVTVKEIVDFEIGLVQKVILAVKRVIFFFKKLFAKK
jgi:hypothetical protein